MKNFLIAFFVFLIWSIFGMWYHSCIIKEICNDNEIKTDETVISKTTPEVNNEIDTKPIVDVDSNPFEIKDKNGNILFTFPDNLGIKSNNHEVSFPNGNNTFNNSVFEFLNLNQNKELIITGLINSDESANNSVLGLNRANFIKDLLIKFGINADKITVKSKLQDYHYDANGNYSGGILFDFVDISEKKLKTIESGIANKTLYSGFGSKEFRADNTLQAYALELKNYLNKYPNKSANIVGHTDSVGDLEANDWYGMERAKNVKRYLESQGIAENRLIASSKGETEPIESNGTFEGRQKNRRIEIKVN